MLRPSPASRVMDTPGTRCIDSARFESGNLAMSSERIESIAPADSRLSVSAAFKLARKPVTTTSSMDSAPAGASVSIDEAFCECALLANPTRAVAIARETAREISGFRATDLIDSDIGSPLLMADRKSTRLNSSHSQISYAVFCLKKKKQQNS